MNEENENIQGKRSGVFRQWFPLATVVTLCSLLIYGTFQQSMRSSADDPQIQVVEDISALLINGTPPQAVLPQDLQISISESLSLYVIIFDANGKVVASTAQLDGKTPVPPPGVFIYTKNHKQDRITWEPKPNMRSAIVVNYYEANNNSGFILAGRSLREVEKRISKLTFNIVVGWAISLVVTFFAVFLVTRKRSV